MKLSYVHSASIRRPAANTIQVVRMCEAFAHRGARVTLHYPRFLWGNVLGADWRAFYGAGPSFAARPLATLLTPGLARLPGYLPATKTLAYLLLTARAGWTRDDLLFTRCFAAAAVFPRLLRGRPPERRPRVVFEAHDMPPDRLRAAALRRVDGVVAISRALAEDLTRRLGLPADGILVAHDGVPARWLDDVADRDAARRRLGLAPRAPLVVYTGRLHSGTFALLREAAGELGREAEVLAVGPAARGWRTPSGAGAAAGEPGVLRCVGPVPAPRVRDYQAAADVLVAPYSRELRWAGYTSPLKIFEYMAAGRPIVASNLPVLSEILDHGADAWLVDLDDAGALAAGVRRVLADPGLAASLARHARRAVAAHTWESRAEAILRRFAPRCREEEAG